MAHTWKKVMNLLRSFLRFLLLKPLLYLSDRHTSKPDKTKVFQALDALYEKKDNPTSKDSILLNISGPKTPVIILSDQHKGNGNGADDFVKAEDNYIHALDYYYKKGFSYVNLGDSEELWKFNIFSVIKNNTKNFTAEKKFVQAGRFYKVFGNHDLFWKIDPLAGHYLAEIYGHPIPIYASVTLHWESTNGETLHLFCTHGHQGDEQSDGNKFSIWFVTYIWAPFQSFLKININTPANDISLKSVHNQMMYEWSRKNRNCVLITGHTHQPVYNSLTHLERLYLKYEKAVRENDQTALDNLNAEIPKRRKESDIVQRSYKHFKPSYFNTGCCCYNDGTITGIEIDNGQIRLVKWKKIQGKTVRQIAEEEPLQSLLEKLNISHFENRV